MLSIVQEIFRWFSSKDTFEKAKAESQSWYFKCECGNKFTVWEIGGIRYKAKGNPVRLGKCNKCGKTAVRMLLKK